MNSLFYIAAIVALAATLRVVTGKNAVHALLYLIVSLLAVAVIFFMLGAPFVAALEVIIYAGAIMVLFVFVMMLLNLGKKAERQEKQLLPRGIFGGPAILSAVLIVCFIILLNRENTHMIGQTVVGPKTVGVSMFSEYVLGVEMAGMLLLAALVGAYHLGRSRQLDDDPDKESEEKQDTKDTAVKV